MAVRMAAWKAGWMAVSSGYLRVGSRVGSKVDLTVVLTVGSTVRSRVGSKANLTVDSTVGLTAGCWDEAMAYSGVGLRAGWMTARIVVKKAGWVAV